jgi:HJR/Mrr/RecB family endonuclease
MGYRSGRARTAPWQATKGQDMDWLFRCNPKRFDLASELKGGLTTGDWAMNQHRDLISPGDRVFFWQTGPQSQMLAIGHVTSPVHERDDVGFGPYCVDVVFDHKIVPPFTRDEALDDNTLNRFQPFKWAMGTNFLVSDPAIVAELDRLLVGRLVRISASSPIRPNLETQKSLDDAIKQANADVERKLRDYIGDMDPKAFEWLARNLFLKLGYNNAEVTGKSGDGGIDVRATVVAGGVTNILTCIQVKRQKIVGRPVVQSLRGSLGPHEVGVLLTSGRFSDEAIEDAADETKKPITLINGSQLIELLIEYEIGARQKSVLRLYRLELDDLSLEKLKLVAEGIGEET